MEGTKTAVLVKLLQETFKVHTDQKYINLYRKVERYVTYYTKANQLDEQMHKATPEQVTKYVENYNAIERMTHLCKLQEKRIEKVLKKEDKLGDNGLLMKQASDEIKIAGFLFKDLADAQMKAGIITLAPKVYPTIAQTGEEVVKDTITTR